MEENVEIRIKTMKILQILSTDEKNCNQMLNAECASRLILKLKFRSVKLEREVPLKIDQQKHFDLL